MAKLLKKHFGLGGKKTSHRTDCSAQKSNSTQELTPKSPTRYRSSVSLSTSSHQDSFDTHSLKSYFGSENPSQNHPFSGTSGRHEHGSSSKQHGNYCRHQGSGSTSKEQCSLSPRGSCSIDATHHSFHNASVAEESDVFDESPLDGSSLGDITPGSSQMPPPRVLDEYCDPVDLKKNVTTAEGGNLLGGCSPNHLQPDDDYSVPYEVKKIMPEGKLRERFMANGNKSNGSAVPHDFDEPQEWLAQLSVATGDHTNHLGSSNQQTPLMTPKKSAKRTTQSIESNHDDKLQHIDEVNDTAQSSEILALPLDPTETIGQPAEDVSESSSTAATPSSTIPTDALTNESTNGTFESSIIVGEEDVMKCADMDSIVKPPITSPAHTTPSPVENCKHSSKQNNHHCCHGKSCSAKKSDKLRPSKSDEAAESDNSGINVKDIVPLDVPIEQQSWYHGPLGRIEAEELLRQQPQGTFLVRQSESNKLDYSLSLKSSNGFLHIKIVGQEGSYILGQFSQPFESIPRMVEFFCHAKLPLRGNEQITLTYPLLHGGHP